MTTAEYLEQLAAQGVRLRAEGDQLRYSAPRGALTPAVRDELTRRKAEVLAYLRQPVGAIPPVSRTGPLALSFGQQRLWFLQQLNPQSAAYNIPLALRLQGPLQGPALAQSLAHLARRHESLRTYFAVAEQQPVQIIAPAEPWAHYTLDTLACTPAEAPARLAALAWQPFDLAAGPLWRTQLLQLGPTEHILALVFHHIIFDGWSQGVFYRELATLYAAYAAGAPPMLPPLDIQYADFAAWERQRVASADDAGLAYWREQLKGELPSLALPTDRPRPAVQQFEGRTCLATLPPPLAAALGALGRQAGATLFMTLLAAFDVLLFRYGGQTEVVVGTPAANRLRSEVEGLIGFFVNTLVLRNQLSGELSFRDLLARVREGVLAASTHQGVPLQCVVEELRPERDLSRQALFQVMFALQTAEAEGPALAGLEVTPVAVANPTAKFDLTLEVTESAAGLVCAWEYNTALFDPDTVARLAGHWQVLLEGLVAEPDRPLAALPVLTLAERHHLLVDWNTTQAESESFVDCHALFEAQVERMPGTIALKMAGGGTGWLTQGPLTGGWTYAQLNQRANQLARYLRKLGVGPDVPVGICVERSPDMVVALLGILKAGGAYVPLDPAYPNDRLAFMLADSGAAVLLIQTHLAGKLQALAAGPAAPRIVDLEADWPAIAQEAETNLPAFADGDHLAYIIYTSGSTGTPKGVQIPRWALANILKAMRQRPGLHPQDVWLAVTTLAFDIAGLEIYLPLVTGAQLVIAPRSIVADGVRLAATLEKFGVTVMQATPMTWRLLIEAGWHGRPALRAWCGGEALSADLAAHLLKRVGELWNLYGPTETTIWSTLYRVDEAQAVIPIGRPTANTQVYILDENRQLVPVGVPGELYIGGLGLARGYLHRPELTAEKFVAHPFSADPAARLYRTGDLARFRPEGVLEYLGRLDAQVKVRGFRIELGEIETVLSQHPAVQATVVVAAESPARGRYLAAYYIPRQWPAPAASDLAYFLAQRLPDYMLPAVFVPLPAFPQTPNGKVNRRALPRAEPPRPSAAYAAPRNLLEEQLASVWGRVLALDRVGIHDDFFDLGGHSLQIAQIVFQIKQVFNIDLALADFFRAPTVAGLAQVLLAAARGLEWSGPPGALSVDLDAEVVLDPAIEARPAAAPADSEPAVVFLTGATGFLGTFLLAELLNQTEAEVCCLLRAPEPDTGRARLKQNLVEAQLWRDEFGSRLRVVLGDLERPCLGLAATDFAALARRVETIYHAGALVNFVYPYARLKAANVQGTQEVFRLAALAGGRPVHYISTLSVFDTVELFDGRVIYEADDLSHHQALFNGYAQSKWVAEKLARLARARGLPVTIYRPGLISGDSCTGIWKPGDLLTRFIKGCIQLGRLPALKDVWRLVPVDYASRAIVHLSRRAEAPGRAFHLTSPYAFSSGDLAEVIRAWGYPLETPDYAVWQAALVRAAQTQPAGALQPLLTAFREPVTAREPATLLEMYTPEREPSYDDQNLRAGLAGTDIVCPAATRELWAAYQAYFVRSGFLPPPPQPAA